MPTLKCWLTTGGVVSINLAVGYPQIELKVQDPNATKGGRIHLGVGINI